MKQVTLYAVASSKASTKSKSGFWFWTTNPSMYAKSNNLPILRTKVRVDISDIKYDAANGKYVVKSKSLQRKLLSLCEVKK